VFEVLSRQRLSAFVQRKSRTKVEPRQNRRHPTFLDVIISLTASKDSLQRLAGFDPFFSPRTFNRRVSSGAQQPHTLLFPLAFQIISHVVLIMPPTSVLRVGTAGRRALGMLLGSTTLTSSRGMALRANAGLSSTLPLNSNSKVLGIPNVLGAVAATGSPLLSIASCSRPFSGSASLLAVEAEAEGEDESCNLLNEERFQDEVDVLVVGGGPVGTSRAPGSNSRGTRRMRLPSETRGRNELRAVRVGSLRPSGRAWHRAFTRDVVRNTAEESAKRILDRRSEASPCPKDTLNVDTLACYFGLSSRRAADYSSNESSRACEARNFAYSRSEGDLFALTFQCSLSAGTVLT
jgi:hypothetical protein